MIHLVPPLLPNVSSAPLVSQPIPVGFAELYFKQGALVRRISGSSSTQDVVLDREIFTGVTVGQVLAQAYAHLLNLSPEGTGTSGLPGLNGKDGRQIILRVDSVSDSIQYAYAATNELPATEWAQLVPLSALRVKGDPGTPGTNGVSIQGPPGRSAYEVWLDAGNTGTVQDFINFLSGYNAGTFAQMRTDVNTLKAQQPFKADLEAGTVPLAQLPESIKDVEEYNTLEDFPATGRLKRLYVAINQGNPALYRWGGTVYQLVGKYINNTDALPEGVTNKYHTDQRVIALINQYAPTSNTGTGSVNLNNITTDVSISDSTKGLVLTDSNNIRWRITISTQGELISTYLDAPPENLLVTETGDIITDHLDNPIVVD